MGSASPLGSCVSSVNTSSSVARPRLCTENPEARNLTPAKTWFTLVLDYPRPARDSRGFRYVAERSHSRFTTLGSFSGCAADGARNSLHILRPARCGHSQDPLRLPWPRGYGVLAGRVRRARAAPPGASDVGRSRPGCISCRRALRARPRGDELLALPGHRPHTPWRRRYPRVPGSPRCGCRRLPPDARPAMGLARRDRYPAARAPRYVRGDGSRPRGCGLRAVGSMPVGLLYPSLRPHGERLCGWDRACARALRGDALTLPFRDSRRGTGPARPEAPPRRLRRGDALHGHPFLAGPRSAAQDPRPHLRRPYEPGAGSGRPRRSRRAGRTAGDARRGGRSPRDHRCSRSLPLRKARRGLMERGGGIIRHPYNRMTVEYVGVTKGISRGRWRARHLRGGAGYRRRPRSGESHRRRGGPGRRRPRRSGQDHRRRRRREREGTRRLGRGGVRLARRARQQRRRFRRPVGDGVGCGSGGLARGLRHEPVRRLANLPLIKGSRHGRIENVASGAGSHGESNFGLTTGGGSAATYSVSKAALNALTAKLAAELDGEGVLVNSVDPGLTATAPGMEEMGARPIPEGAASAVWAVTLPDNGPTGGFFRDGKPLPW